MKNYKKQLIILAAILAIITAIYCVIYSKVAFSEYVSLSAKVVFNVILVVLILAVGLSLFFVLKPSKNNINEEKSSKTDKKIILLSILIGLGINVIMLCGLLIFFFMAISG